MISIKQLLGLFGVLFFFCLFIIIKPVDADFNSQGIPCSDFHEDLVVPDDGSWLSICLVDPNAPKDQ